MSLCFFASDLHGYIPRYRLLFERIITEKPTAVFLGGDLLPHGIIQPGFGQKPIKNFITEFFAPSLTELLVSMRDLYPRIFIILGNDDGKAAEDDLKAGEAKGLWEYIHGRCVDFGIYSVFGYAYIPPTPFQLKDWEQYDVSRHLEPGCIAPEDGYHTISIQKNHIQFATIQNGLQKLVRDMDMTHAIFLFHAPPYQTNLDRCALDGQFIDHAPLDVHIGSVAIKRFIEERQPLVTLHGHVHETTTLTGKWFAQIGRTVSFTAAHDGQELALVRFNLQKLGDASRELISW